MDENNKIIDDFINVDLKKKGHLSRNLILNLYLNLHFMNKHGFDSIVVYSITAYSFFVNRMA